MDQEDMDVGSGDGRGLRNTSVIVSITGDHSASEDGQSTDTEQPSRSTTCSPSGSGLASPQLLMQNKHLQVRHTLSEPLKAKTQRPRVHRMSPITKRYDSGLGKTLSVGAGLDTASPSASVVWRPGGDGSAPHSPSAMDSAHSSNESLNTSTDGGRSLGQDTPTIPSLTNIPAAMRMAVGSGGTLAVIPTQEQLDAIHKKQLELLTFLEQQKQQMAQAGGVSPEMIKFPVTMWPMGTNPLLAASSTAATTNSTPSPTPSISSIDSAISGSGSSDGGGSTAAVLNSQRRPLSGSLSAPGLQQPMSDTQYESLVRQFQLQHQHIIVQQQQLYQHYLEQQQRLLQQAIFEKKHFEEQQRQLSTLHMQQQQQLQGQQQLLRNMQEQQLMQLQRQQQMLIMHTIGIQQQHQAQIQAKKPVARRIGNKTETLSLPYSPSSNSQAASGGEDVAMDLSGALQQHQAASASNSNDSTGSSHSPSVVVSPVSAHEVMSAQTSPGGGGTGLVYDTMMLKHNCCCGSSHPEHPGRLQSIWARLHETGVVQQCTRLRARKASLAELQTLHSENHVRLYGRPSQRKPGQDRRDNMRAFVQLSCGGVGVDSDTFWNDTHTSNAARMAVGSVIELAEKVSTGDIRNGFALIRPPGHHALPNQAMAFCYFNNVALAAKAMVSKHKKVAVVDWDIHHGNGTQQIFYDSPSCMYISIHRFDNGTFFPGTGRSEEIGSGAGLGFNVNIAFSGKQTFQGPTASNYGDPEYLAAFRSIVIPVLRDFAPDIILVSAGFNATSGHPPTLGGYSVTPQCYAHLTRLLMSCGSGRIVMALEGGYELMSLCQSSEACMRALLGDKLPALDSSSLNRPPQPPAVASLEKTIGCHKSYWPSLSGHLLNMSQLEAERCDETITALRHLSMGGVTRSPSTGSNV